MISEQFLAPLVQVTQLVFIACCIFGVSSLLASSTYLAFRKSSISHHAFSSHKGLIFIALSALFASTIVTIWLSIPHYSQLPFVVTHCHDNDCTIHIPEAFDQTLLNFLSASFIIGMAMFSLIFIQAQQNKLEERINNLLQLSQNEKSVNRAWAQTTVIEAAEHVFLNVGMIEPRFLVSSNLVDSLEDKELSLLFAYEYSKAKQFENVKVKLVQLTCLFWIGKARRKLLNDLRSAIHQIAHKQVEQLLGKQKIHIPESILHQLPKDINEFVLKTQSKNHAPQQPLNKFDGSLKVSLVKYPAGVIYFIGLVVITANVIHFIFELVS